MTSQDTPSAPFNIGLYREWVNRLATYFAERYTYRPRSESEALELQELEQKYFQSLNDLTTQPDNLVLAIRRLMCQGISAWPQEVVPDQITIPMVYGRIAALLWPFIVTPQQNLPKHWSAGLTYLSSSTISNCVAECREMYEASISSPSINAEQLKEVFIERQDDFYKMLLKTGDHRGLSRLLADLDNPERGAPVLELFAMQPILDLVATSSGLLAGSQYPKLLIAIASTTLAGAGYLATVAFEETFGGWASDKVNELLKLQEPELTPSPSPTPIPQTLLRAEGSVGATPIQPALNQVPIATTSAIGSAVHPPPVAQESVDAITIPIINQWMEAVNRLLEQHSDILKAAIVATFLLFSVGSQSSIQQELPQPTVEVVVVAPTLLPSLTPSPMPTNTSVPLPTDTPLVMPTGEPTFTATTIPTQTPTQMPTKNTILRPQSTSIPAPTAVRAPTVTTVPVAISVCLSSDEAHLAQLINDYRASRGLPPIPLSRVLTFVARTHVRDLHEYRPDTGTDNRGKECNPHSWSSNGPWSPVCYTDDHEYAIGMWKKPSELSGGAYSGYGYEIAAWGSTSIGASESLQLWQGSPLHNAVIVEEGDWATADWSALGVGIYEGYAVVWFGKQTDPQGAPDICT